MDQLEVCREALVRFIQGMKLENFSDFSDGELAGFLVGAAHAGFIQPLGCLTFKATLELCREAVAKLRNKGANP